MADKERRSKEKTEKRKKRKRDADEEESEGSVAKNLKFTIVEVTAETAPAILTAPGLGPPIDVPLQAYYKPNPDTASESRVGRSPIDASDLLLHTSAHPTLEYVAREEEAGDNLMRHYIGVYDPKTGEVLVMEARKLTLRSTLKSELAEADQEEDDDEEEEENLTRLAARNALGEAFGTKKSKKAIRNLTENAIMSESTHANADNPLASAVLSSMPKSANIATREDLQAMVDDAKPRPKANTETEVLAEVYPIEDLVGTANLEVISVGSWLDKIEAGEDVSTSSRFVSHRLRRIVTSKDVLKIKTLRYLLLLLDWYAALKPGGHEGKKLSSNKDEIRKAVSIAGPISSAIMDNVRRQFAPDGVLNKWAVDCFMTHVCALALHTDDFTTDVHDLKEDLKLEAKAIKDYFTELGCKVSAPAEAERKKRGWSKAEAQVHRIAKLRLPLEFPKQRLGMRKKRA